MHSLHLGFIAVFSGRQGVVVVVVVGMCLPVLPRTETEILLNKIDAWGTRMLVITKVYNRSLVFLKQADSEEKANYMRMPKGRRVSSHPRDSQRLGHTLGKA